MDIQPTDNTTQPAVRLSPEEVKSRFPEIAPRSLRQQLMNIPKAEAIAILQVHAAQNDVTLSDSEARAYYDQAFPRAPESDDYDFESDLARHLDDLEETSLKSRSKAISLSMED